MRKAMLLIVEKKDTENQKTFDLFVLLKTKNKQTEMYR